MVLREKVYQTIKERIIKGQYLPAEPLNEREIIEELHVSRTPFREAINALNEEGLVQIYPNRGIFVREITVKSILNALNIRCQLEPYITQLACQYMPDDVIASLSERCKACLDAEYWELLAEDEHYHLTLLDYTNNEQLNKIMRNLYAQNAMQAAKYDSRKDNLVSEVRKQAALESLQEHIQILEYIAKRDEENAMEMTRKHISRARKRVLEIG